MSRPQVFGSREGTADLEAPRPQGPTGVRGVVGVGGVGGGDGDDGTMKTVATGGEWPRWQGERRARNTKHDLKKTSSDFGPVYSKTGT